MTIRSGLPGAELGIGNGEGGARERQELPPLGALCVHGARRRTR
ncbi:hypothetical protein [Massilia sp. BSC265]|nr:hypothetical protein [Massilia sp. BSC265]